MIFSTWILLWIIQTISCKLIEIQDKNDLKKVLASHSNILIVFSENDKIEPNLLSILKDVAVKGNELAKVLSINCQLNKKLCKQYKVNPKPFILQHFHKGKFNKIYDRKLRLESFLRFLEDPIGDIAWEEDDTAKDVMHVRGSQDLQRIVGKFKTNIPPLMLMFYAPWCGYCKQMKPEFAAAATTLKGKTIFIGINGDLSTTDDLKQAFNVSGYPSVFLIQDGNKVFKYDSDNSRDALVKFVHNPAKPVPKKEVPWSEETSEIDFLTDSSFNDYINQHESVLVMFYAPWCGHCKSMKPVFVDAATKLKKQKIDARIAAIDSTENKNISEEFRIKGFPTVKYFKKGEFQFDVNERSAEGLVKFMLDPQKPVEPKVEIPWKEEDSLVLHPSADELRQTLKRFKHALVMFYAPWCGHCKATKPGFTSAANRMQDVAKVAFVAVDCADQSYSAICASEGISGFPTIRYFNYGKNTSYSEYVLAREEDDFVAFMTNPASPKLDARRHWRQIAGNEAVLVSDDANFAQNILSQAGGALVMFYSPRCAPCMAMKPAYVNAAIRLQQSLPSCHLGAVDATSETHLAAQYRVNGFPTFIYFTPHGDWFKYNGDKDENGIVDFMTKKEAEFRQLEEDRRVQEEKKAEEKRIREENERAEKKRIQEEKDKKEMEKKKMEEEKRVREENERKQAEIEKKIKEEKIKAEEKRIKEETERKQMEKEQKIKVEKEKRKADEERIRAENEKAERKRIQDEKARKEIEEKRIREEYERQQREIEKKIKEENEKRKAEESRMKEDNEMKRIQEEDNRKLSEARKAEIVSEESEPSEDVSGENEDETEKGKSREKDEWGMEKLSGVDEFLEVVKSPKLSVFYFHKDNRKATVRDKLVKLLNKRNREAISSFNVDCVLAVELCDYLNIVDVPTVTIYSSEEHVGSLSGSWGEDNFNELLEHSATRDEL